VAWSRPRRSASGAHVRCHEATGHVARDATLGVDADNKTGAVRLYERAGMGVERQYDIYRKELA
jgi:ribosomal protein S18 acetylase RimI-like enzyme